MPHIFSKHSTNHLSARQLLGVDRGHRLWDQFDPVRLFSYCYEAGKPEQTSQYPLLPLCTGFSLTPAFKLGIKHSSAQKTYKLDYNPVNSKCQF